MKRLLPFFLVIFVFSCNKQDDEFNPHSKPEQELTILTPQEINKYINNSIQKNGSFSWTDAEEFVLWSAIVNGNNILTIGYGSEDYSNLKSTNNLDIKNEILTQTRELEKGNLKKDSDVLLFDDPVLNVIDVTVKDMNTLTELLKNQNIRFLEPPAYLYFEAEGQLKSTKGCDKNAQYVSTADYRSISPGSLVSWTYDKHNITQAWNYSTGRGITVSIIDTGVNSGQSLLGSAFNDGYSSGRYVYRYGTYVDSFWPWSTTTDGWHDKCGHGTRMAATIASPRNDNGAPVGVAYNANLISYRGTSDVVLDGYHEQKGVANALTSLAKRSDVKIISMSIGHIINIGRISDAIKYAYSRGKLIIAAGGTSTNFTNWAGVIFPASMNETVAVTGITDGSGYTECEVCHKGSKIDFTIVMQRSGNSNRVAVAAGYYNNTRDYIGGSSVATATTAGIAALVWAKNPTWTRSQVLQKLKESSDLYPGKSSNFGYGKIDALKAVQ